MEVNAQDIIDKFQLRSSVTKSKIIKKLEEITEKVKDCNNEDQFLFIVLNTKEGILTSLLSNCEKQTAMEAYFAIEHMLNEVKKDIVEDAIGVKMGE